MIVTILLSVLTGASQPLIPLCPYHRSSDYSLGPSIVEDYYNTVTAPEKKMYWFDNSAHFPHFEEPEYFRKIMVDELRPMVQGS